MTKVEASPGFETFDADVKAARKARRLARKMLAEMSGIEWQYLANIENKGTIPVSRWWSSLSRSAGFLWNGISIPKCYFRKVSSSSGSATPNADSPRKIRKKISLARGWYTFSCTSMSQLMQRLLIRMSFWFPPIHAGFPPNFLHSRSYSKHSGSLEFSRIRSCLWYRCCFRWRIEPDYPAHAQCSPNGTSDSTLNFSLSPSPCNKKQNTALHQQNGSTYPKG